MSSNYTRTYSIAGMNGNAGLYSGVVFYPRQSGPYQSLSLPWWVKTPEPTYPPRHGCRIEPLICGENVFRQIEMDIRAARRSVEIITWGFDPGMVLVRGGAAESGIRYGELLKEVASRDKDPVQVRLLVWHDDAASQTQMKNIPGFYGQTLSDMTSMINGYYSEDHQAYNAEWLAQAVAGDLKNIQLRVRSVPQKFVKPALANERVPMTTMAWIAKLYATHHQKMMLIDYRRGPSAIGYVMGHNSVTDFWDTEAHRFQDPRRERFFKKNPARAWKQGPDLTPDAYLPGYTPSEYEIQIKERAVQEYLELNSHVAKPYQDVSCRLAGPILYDLNLNFCQAWEKSERPHTLFQRMVAFALPQPAKWIVEYTARELEYAADVSNFVENRRKVQLQTFRHSTYQHSVQLLRTQPIHGEKTIKECYANLTRQMQHYIFIQNQYVQYDVWAEHLLECMERKRSYGFDKPVYVFLVTSTPESAGMDLPTYDVAEKLGHSEAMEVEHAETMRLVAEGKSSKPLNVEQLSAQGINVVMASMWCCANRERALRAEEYEEIYIHAKVAIVDDVAFTIGSANLNLRSMAMDSELNVISQAPGIAYKLRCTLFEQCMKSKDNSPRLDMRMRFSEWRASTARNFQRKKSGAALDGMLVSFHVDRKPAEAVI